jgi:hypothetical protein
MGRPRMRYGWLDGLTEIAFCERARKCGIPIYADTRIRLYPIGSYGYSREDVGEERQRFGKYTLPQGKITPCEPPAGDPPKRD